MEIISNDPQWRLESLSIEYQNYGDYKGKHVGKVRFQNKHSEAFMFNLSPERTEKYLSLISEELVANASNLGDKLLASLNLLSAPKTLQVTESKNSQQ